MSLETLQIGEEGWNHLDLKSHELFETISWMLEETNMTPADVAENLMPKSDDDNAETCLTNLIKALQNSKEIANRNSELNGEDTDIRSSDGESGGGSSDEHGRIQRSR
ncbi:AAA+ ATPase domain-containing protein [Artemisia annua]|uniref:AAA+ ATPase domain-containing protein n=1 Tax=Artemisia annua TaxID=35608 RepID=A0A2U1KMH0_ARTAN|nr:AAA+ ATPase domain-containing protein [Artemisia annua]